MIHIECRAPIEVVSGHQDTGSGGNDHGNFRPSHLLTQGFAGLGYVIGIKDSYVLNANSAAELFHIDAKGWITVEGVAGGRVFLASGHGGDAVIEDNYGCR